MKEIEFKQSASNKIYKDYIERIRRVTKGLSKEDQEDVLMEFNSHIFEYMQKHQEESEVDHLMDVLETLGAPEEVLQSLVAEKTLTTATRTFNPVMLFKGLVMNLANGISYIFFAFLYLFLFAFVFVMVAKVIWPTEVGMFFQDGKFMLLGIPDADARAGMTEVLGNLFIPVMAIITIAWYFFITLLLRIKQSFLK